MANKIESFLGIQEAGPKLDELRPLIEGVIEDAQSWHPRRWIHLRSIVEYEGAVLIDFATDWDRGDKLVAAICNKVATYKATGGWEGECQPSQGGWFYDPDEGLSGMADDYSTIELKL